MVVILTPIVLMVVGIPGFIYLSIYFKEGYHLGLVEQKSFRTLRMTFSQKNHVPSKKKEAAKKGSQN